MSLPCKWDVQMGKIIEFMENFKGLKAFIGVVVVAIVVQVGTFLVLWGSLTHTVKTQEKNIDTLFELWNKVGVAHAGEAIKK
jgi:hypothetical protein